MSARTVRNRRLFFQQVNQFLKVRMPLDKALGIMGKNAASPALSDLYYAMARSLSHGRGLSDAMAGHPEVFSPYETDIVRAGEESGDLATVLTWLSDLYRDRASQSRTFKANILYLCLVSLVGTGILAAIFGFLVPLFGNMYADFGGSLPSQTRNVLGIGNFLAEYMDVLALALCLVAALGWWAWKRFPEKASLCLTAVPFLGAHWMLAEAMGFFRAMGGALGFGVSLPRALDTSLAFVSHPYLKARLLALAPAMVQGAGLADSLEDIFRFPKALAAFARLGEGDGKLGKALSRPTGNQDLVWAWKWRKLQWFGYFWIALLLYCAVYTLRAMYLPIFKMAASIG